MLVHRDGQTATLLANGRVLIAGGGADPTSAELFNPATGLFEPSRSMVIGRSSDTATLLKDGRVLIAGGVGAYGSAAPAELYTA